MNVFSEINKDISYLKMQIGEEKNEEYERKCINEFLDRNNVIRKLFYENGLEDEELMVKIILFMVKLKID